MADRVSSASPWGVLKLSDVAEFDILQVDAGFTCIPAGSLRTALRDSTGELFIHCENGKHNLEGQCDHDDRLVGLRRIFGQGA
jgi:hypothetical protein